MNIFSNFIDGKKIEHKVIFSIRGLDYDTKGLKCYIHNWRVRLTSIIQSLKKIKKKKSIYEFNGDF